MAEKSMKLGNRLLFCLSQAELARNGKFRNLHKGQSCYIFGNGVSLKSMDLGKFHDRIAIGCNTLFVHKDFDRLDCRYYQIPVTFFYRYRSYYGRLRRNYLSDLYRKKIKEHERSYYFTSLSNCFSMRGENIHYLHHFGSRDWSLDECEMDGVFSFMAGATYAMLGTAIYMGFESAVLVGCDYTFTPARNFHFFEKGKGSAQEDPGHPYGALFEEVRKRIDVTTMVLAGMESKVVKYVEYEKYMNCGATYRENTRIVDGWCLDLLQKQGLYNIY